jgi:hypothetical protein
MPQPEEVMESATSYRAVDPGFARAGPRIIDQVAAPIDRSEVRRYLGYPQQAAPNRRVEEALDHWITEAGKRAAPQATYRVFPVADIGKKHVRVETSAGPVEFTGAIGEFLGPASWVAVFIATAGPEVERLAGDMLYQGDPLAGLIVNAVGSERAEAAEAALIDELRAQAHPAGLALSLPYSPGYCGMALTEQRKVFTLLDGGRVGVFLTGDCLMTPLKSVSGLIGLGTAAAVKEQGSPCDRCTRHNCNMRR